jgi:hypothetical protein
MNVHEYFLYVILYSIGISMDAKWHSFNLHVFAPKVIAKRQFSLSALHRTLVRNINDFRN